MARFRTLWKKVGPGLVTGASDDDPSGIAIYSQVGAQSGFQLLWSALFTFPLMVVVQEMCARIGLVTGHGLADNLRHHYPKWIMYLLAILVVAGNTLNIGADIAAMAATARLVVPLPEPFLATFFTVVIALVLLLSSYKAIENFFKWVALTLLVYLVVPFIVGVDWPSALRGTFLPSLKLNSETLLLLVAVFGTTISPYLFFWQTSNEIEERKSRIKQLLSHWMISRHEIKDMRRDVGIGMLLSNVVMWFIIVTAAVTLHANGQTTIATVEEAASALKPLAGNAASLIFSLGVISISFLAIPVLAGSSSYALAETMGWQEGINKKFSQAKQFYTILFISLLIGLWIPLLGIDPIKALFYTGVFYGVTAPVLIYTILHIANNEKVMGKYRNSPLTNALGYLTFVVMTLAIIGAFWL